MFEGILAGFIMDKGANIHHNVESSENEEGIWYAHFVTWIKASHNEPLCIRPLAFNKQAKKSEVVELIFFFENFES